jgi:two-component system CheB/CheR fusion protein
VTEAGVKIVGIGASAGGLAAFRSFFENMPADSGFGFVVVAHLAPDRKSLLPEILARATAMPVVTAADGVLVAANHVHVIPAGVVAILEHGRIGLRPLGAEERYQTTAIDVFFDALAADLGERAIGIVLSGTGHDGALGLKAIREAGGMTIAQGSDGTAPQFAGMPDSAIATGAVDIVVPVEAMPGVLMSSRDVGRRLSHRAPLSEVALKEARLAVCAVLREQVGHDFSRYKEKTFLRRVHRRMQVLNLADYGLYVGRLKSDREESVLLFRDLLIGVTSFFRDSETFGVLERDIIPELFAGKGRNHTVRVWVAGCATGEEAYSIAILLREYAATLEAPPALQVFATDIDALAIAAARAGRYPATLVQGMPAARRQRAFVPTDGGHVVAKDIRDICTFSPHSLIRDPPFSRVDLVSCRNLLIYLDSDLQAQVIPTFHYALVPGGKLLLGSSESVSRFETLFTAKDKKHRIFQKSDVPSTLPLLALRTPSVTDPDKSAGKGAPAAEDLSAQAVSRAKARMLEAHAAPFVVVTASGGVVHYSNRTGRFFEPAPGPPSTNLFDMARPNVRLGLRSALRRAVETGLKVEQRLATGAAGEGEPAVTLLVEPIGGAEMGRMFLVVFRESGRPAGSHDGAVPSEDELRISAALEREIRDLRDEVQTIKEEHETALEELRSSNEELNSVNEELQSSNEELETSREEIQSINEEMSTVNAELSSKVDALDRANSDLKNLFESTRVATVFLDRHLVIRAFTPEVAAVYNLIPSDIGRSLADIVNRLDYRSLREDVTKVLETLTPLERRVKRDDAAAHYLMRILPYRSPDNTVDGSLITFIEVTSIVQAEQHQRLLVDELNHRVKNMLTVVISLATQTLRRSRDLADFSEVFLGRVHTLTNAYELLRGRSWDFVPLRSVLTEELRPFMSEPGGDRAVNISLDGPEVMLDARGALAIGMAVHELSTNAAKFGALSVAEGKVSVTWTIETEGERQFYAVEWRECDGPAVAPPAKPGFGLLLIERGMKHDLGGEAVVEFLTDGVRARLRAPFPLAVNQQTAV